MKVGDTITYTPVTMPEDPPATGVVRKYMPGGTAAADVFNQPMIVIDGVGHWIPARECAIAQQQQHE